MIILYIKCIVNYVLNNGDKPIAEIIKKKDIDETKIMIVIYYILNIYKQIKKIELKNLFLLIQIKQFIR